PRRSSDRSAVSNAFGAVNASHISGDLVVHNNNGAVEAHSIAGAAELTTSFAPISFSDIGTKLNCTASNGNISGNRVGGSAVVRNSFGAVNLSAAAGPDRK